MLLMSRANHYAYSKWGWHVTAYAAEAVAIYDLLNTKSERNFSEAYGWFKKQANHRSPSRKVFGQYVRHLRAEKEERQSSQTIDKKVQPALRTLRNVHADSRELRER